MLFLHISHAGKSELDLTSVCSELSLLSVPTDILFQELVTGHLAEQCFATSQNPNGFKLCLKIEQISDRIHLLLDFVCESNKIKATSHERYILIRLSSCYKSQEEHCSVSHYVSNSPVSYILRTQFQWRVVFNQQFYRIPQSTAAHIWRPLVMLYLLILSAQYW